MATTLNRTFYGGSTVPGSGVYPEDVKILKVFANYAETDYDPLASSDTSVYIPTVDKHSHDDGNIVSIIDRVLAAGGSPIITKLGAEFIYASGDASEYKFVNISGDNITEMTINRSTGTVTTRNCVIDSSEVEAGDSSISVQKTVDPNTGSETFAVSVTDEGIINDKIAPATIQPDKLARKKQISVDGVTIIATAVSDDEVELSAVVPEDLVIPNNTVIYDGQTATETVPCEDGTVYSLDFGAASLSSVTLDLDIAAAEPVDGPTKHCYIRVRNTGSACGSYTISYYTPDGTTCAINWTISPGNKYVYDVLARKSSAGTIAIVSLIGEG